MTDGSLAALLSGSIDYGGDVAIDPGLHGFGGVHGGLALALATDAMARQSSLSALRSVSGNFIRSLEGPVNVTAESVRQGRTAATLHARVANGDRLGLTASATFGGSARSIEPRGPDTPDVEPPDGIEPFVVPPGFVPITESLDIRPVGEQRPYSGGDDPTLRAWIRVLDDDRPVDVLRLIVLADALAPSYAAMLTDLVAIPTVELTIRPTAHVGQSTSPWILLEARSEAATDDGWVHEAIYMWDLDGRHLASGNQLRLALP